MTEDKRRLQVQTFSVLCGKCILLMALLLSSSLAQAKKEDSPNASKKEIQQEQVVKADPIAIPADFQQLLREKEQALKIAQLELQVLDLQIRLLLAVPNDYARSGDSYQKSKSPQSPQSQHPPKQEPKK